MKKITSVPALLVVLTGVWAACFMPATQAGGNPDLQRIEQDILDGLRHCVFTVNAYSPLESGEDGNNSGNPKWKRNVGTALPIDSEGHLLTISCVLKDAEKITVTTDTGEMVPAKVVGVDSRERIAVLKVDPEYVKEVPVSGTLENVVKGNFAYFLGIVPDMEMAVTRGWISEIRTEDGILELLGPVTAGTSGSPILDETSTIIGILAFNIDTDEIDPGLSKYAVIPYEYAYIMARYIINTDMTDVGWLGVAIDLASSGDGIPISEVIESSPAATAGIVPGDRIISFHGATITSARHFIDLLSATAPDDMITMTILRGGKSRSVTVTLSKNPGIESE